MSSLVSQSSLDVGSVPGQQKLTNPSSSSFTIQQIKSQLQRCQQSQHNYKIMIETLNASRKQINEQITSLTQDYQRKLKGLENKISKLQQQNRQLKKNSKVFQGDIESFQERLLEKQKLISKLMLRDSRGTAAEYIHGKENRNNGGKIQKQQNILLSSQNAELVTSDQKSEFVQKDQANVPQPHQKQSQVRTSPPPPPPIRRGQPPQQKPKRLPLNKARKASSQQISESTIKNENQTGLASTTAVHQDEHIQETQAESNFGFDKTEDISNYNNKEKKNLLTDNDVVINVPVENVPVNDNFNQQQQQEREEYDENENISKIPKQEQPNNHQQLLQPIQSQFQQEQSFPQPIYNPSNQLLQKQQHQSQPQPQPQHQQPPPPLKKSPPPPPPSTNRTTAKHTRPSGKRIISRVVASNQHQQQQSIQSFRPSSTNIQNYQQQQHHQQQQHQQPQQQQLNTSQNNNQEDNNNISIQQNQNQNEKELKKNLISSPISKQKISQKQQQFSSTPYNLINDEHENTTTNDLFVNNVENVRNVGIDENFNNNNNNDNDNDNDYNDQDNNSNSQHNTVVAVKKKRTKRGQRVSAASLKQNSFDQEELLQQPQPQQQKLTSRVPPPPSASSKTKRKPIRKAQSSSAIADNDGQALLPSPISQHMESSENFFENLGAMSDDYVDGQNPDAMNENDNEHENSHDDRAFIDESSIQQVEDTSVISNTMFGEDTGIVMSSQSTNFLEQSFPQQQQTKKMSKKKGKREQIKVVDPSSFV